MEVHFGRKPDNGWMRFPFPVGLATLAMAVTGVTAVMAVLPACSPALNWREVRADPTALVALLPCKPDRGTRTVPFAGRETPMSMTGCDADGATFAIASAEIPDPSQASAVIAQWQAATAANLHGAPGPAQPFVVQGAVPAVPGTVPLRVVGTGRRADGSAVQSQALYFAHGGRVFQAVIYASRIPPEAAETFFAGLKFP